MGPCGDDHPRGVTVHCWIRARYVTHGAHWEIRRGQAKQWPAPTPGPRAPSRPLAQSGSSGGGGAVCAPQLPRRLAARHSTFDVRRSTSESQPDFPLPRPARTSSALPHTQCVFDRRAKAAVPVAPRRRRPGPWPWAPRTPSSLPHPKYICTPSPHPLTRGTDAHRPVSTLHPRPSFEGEHPRARAFPASPRRRPRGAASTLHAPYAARTVHRAPHPRASRALPPPTPSAPLPTSPAGPVRPRASVSQRRPHLASSRPEVRCSAPSALALQRSSLAAARTQGGGGDWLAQPAGREASSADARGTRAPGE